MTSLIVLNYNDYQTTGKFVMSVQNFKSIDKIIVVDNCSTDCSFEHLLLLQNKKTDVIQSDRNGGYAYGNNLGIKYAIKHYHSDLLFISNPDVLIDDTVLTELVSKAVSMPQCGQITCKMECTSGTKLPIAWKIPAYKDCIMENFIILKRLLNYDNGYPDNYYNSEIVEAGVVPGSFFLIKRKAYEDIGGFDEGTFLYCEEIILAHQLKDKGYKNYILTNLSYIHKHSVSINKSIASSVQRLRVCFNSRQYYCKKYLCTGLLKNFILRLTFEIGLFDYKFVNFIIRKKGVIGKI